MITRKDRLIARKVIAKMHGDPYWLTPLDIDVHFRTSHNTNRYGLIRIKDLGNGRLSVTAGFTSRRDQTVSSIRVYSKLLGIDFNESIGPYHLSHGDVINQEIDIGNHS